MAAYDTGRDEFLTTHYIDDPVKDIDISVTTKEIMNPSPDPEKLQPAESPETQDDLIHDESVQILRHMSIDAPGLRIRVEVTGK